MITADMKTTGGNQMPTTNKVEVAIFVAPTRSRVRLLKPNSLNSLITL